MKLSINQPQRYGKMRAHTATHLLHAILTTYFPNTKQAGSLVDTDFLRFDFYAETLLTNEQIKDIEKTLNQYIYEALPVTIIETTFDEAKKLWAKAFFEDKYGDIVRLVRIFQGEKAISAELCGGTHIENTKEIWSFTIISQESVASGIKRLTAITGPKVIEKIHEQEKLLNNQINVLQVKSVNQIEEKTKKILKEYEELENKVKELTKKDLLQKIQLAKKEKKSEFNCVIECETGTDFKLLASLAQENISISTNLFYTKEGNFLILTDNQHSAKELVEKLGLKWWGNEKMVQGRDPKIIEILNK